MSRGIFLCTWATQEKQLCHRVMSQSAFSCHLSSTRWPMSLDGAILALALNPPQLFQLAFLGTFGRPHTQPTSNAEMNFKYSQIVAIYKNACIKKPKTSCGSWECTKYIFITRSWKNAFSFNMAPYQWLTITVWCRRQRATLDILVAYL